MRFGVYVDLVLQRDDRGFSSDIAFVEWLSGLAREVDEVRLFARVAPSPGRAPHRVDPAISVVGLPFYAGLRGPWTFARRVPTTMSAFRESLAELDAVLLFGPHPLSAAFAYVARRKRIPVFVGVRQDFREYVRYRSRGVSRIVELGVAQVLEGVHRREARWGGALVVNPALARPYRRQTDAVLVTGFSLVGAEDIVDEADVGGTWTRTPLVLSVSRLDAEKNPLLLPEVLAQLREAADWRLVVAGDGSMREALEAKVLAMGLGPYVRLAGSVDSAALAALYRSAAVLLHVSWTEGVPQVFFEAAAAGLPIVATDVGGVRAALGDGTRGALVPPGDARAAADAVASMGDATRRVGLARSARTWVVEETLTAQARRVARFVRETVASTTKG